ncbi:MAG: hypothetical protein NTW94_07365 [Legionellales bacterium]|nr:hypothetical protein [Legionellales bacterium]
MEKKIIYQTSLLVSGIMCHQGCGARIHQTLSPLDELKQQGLIPNDAQLIVDAEPQAFGVHRLNLILESTSATLWSATSNDASKKDHSFTITTHFKNKLQGLGFEVLDGKTNPPLLSSKKTNSVNLSVNLISLLAISLPYR